MELSDRRLLPISRGEYYATTLGCARSISGRSTRHKVRHAVDIWVSWCCVDQNCMPSARRWQKKIGLPKPMLFYIHHLISPFLFRFTSRSSSYSNGFKGLWSAVEELQKDESPLLDITFPDPAISSKYRYYLHTVPSTTTSTWSKVMTLVDQKLKYHLNLFILAIKWRKKNGDCCLVAVFFFF